MKKRIYLLSLVSVFPLLVSAQQFASPEIPLLKKLVEGIQLQYPGIACSPFQIKKIDSKFEGRAFCGFPPGTRDLTLLVEGQMINKTLFPSKINFDYIK